VVVGGVLILAGALLAVDLLAVGGMLLGAIAVLADFWGPLGNPGVGWKQHAVIVIGLLLVAVGLPRLLRRRRAACAELSGKEAVARRP